MTASIPWPFAQRIGGLVAGAHPLAGSYHIEQLASTLPAVVAAANEAVAEETGLALAGLPEVAVVSRREWVERNVSAFSSMLEPAERRLAERIERTGVDGANLAHRVVAGQTGAVLGFLARRVLGQYELVVPTGEQGDSIAFVGGNLLHMERAHQLNPKEFRTWVALHESAHRAQFVGVGWMRGYFSGLVTEMVESAVPDEARLSRLVEQIVSSRRTRTPVIDESGLLGLFSGPSQRAALDRIQALMSLLEGHGHVVMDRLGDRMLVSRPRMSSLLKARRSDPRTALFFKLTGLELKMRQYEEGERFVLAVEKQAGWQAISLAWSDAGALPTLAEIRAPKQWLKRVA